MSAAPAAAAARASSDWRWLPGTGRWRPHVTHIRALRAGVGRLGDWSRAGPRGRGAAGLGACPRGSGLGAAGSPHLLLLAGCGFRTPPRLPDLWDRRPHSRPQASKPVRAPHNPRSHPLARSQCLVTRLQPLVRARGGNSERVSTGPRAMRIAAILVLRWSREPPCRWISQRKSGIHGP